MFAILYFSIFNISWQGGLAPKDLETGVPFSKFRSSPQRSSDTNHHHVSIHLIFPPPLLLFLIISVILSTDQCRASAKHGCPFYLAHAAASLQCQGVPDGPCPFFFCLCPLFFLALLACSNFVGMISSWLFSWKNGKAICELCRHVVTWATEPHTMGVSLHIGGGREGWRRKGATSSYLPHWLSSCAWVNRLSPSILQAGRVSLKSVRGFARGCVTKTWHAGKKKVLEGLKSHLDGWTTDIT